MCSGYLILLEIVWLLIFTNLNKYLIRVKLSTTPTLEDSRTLLVLRLHLR
jgi:hypothetical protein